MGVFQLFPPFRALTLVALPKVIQSVLSALSDFYTWKLGEKIYGQDSNVAWSVVCVSLSLSHIVLLSDVDRTYVVLGNDFQPLALVLFDEDIFQLPGNNLDHRSSLLLAMGDPWGRKGEQAKALPTGAQRS